MVKIYFLIKVKLNFTNGNYSGKNLYKSESFQHYYVFVTQIKSTVVERNKIYINLTFEVLVKHEK